MHSNPNLVPTVITNANGWMTTVYRKPQKHTTNSSSIPAPAFENNQTLATRIAKLYEELQDEPLSEDKLQETRSLIRNNYSFEMLKVIEAEMAKGGAVAKGLCHQIDHEHYDDDIKNALRFYPLLGIEDYPRVTALVEALNRYPLDLDLHNGVPRDPVSDQEAVAVLKLTHLIDLNTDIPIRHPEHPLNYAPEHSDNGGQWRYATIRNENLVRYIKSHPDEVQGIAEIVAKHNVTDPNAIIGIREGILPALSDGAL